MTATINPCLQPHHRADDPTELTVKMLLRELENLREVIEARLDGNDKITVILQEGQRNTGVEARMAVENLKDLHAEKFSSIQTQFQERDVRTEQTSKDGKVAVDAALQAAKEAVGEQNKSSALAIGKSESATTKQIDQIGITIQGMTSNLNDKIEDVRARLNVIDGRVKGGAENKDDHRSNIAIGVSVIMAVVAVAALSFGSRTPPAPQTTPQAPVINVYPAGTPPPAPTQAK